jgi:predicted dithiol-disulfide oxidoreductase (DUF899 family)
MGWTFPWASTIGTDFNLDFGVYFTDEQRRGGGVEYNYRQVPPPDGKAEGVVAALTGTDVDTFTREFPGMSAFALEGGVVYHTYSAYARGLDALWGLYQWLDRAPKGRNEKDFWMRHRDRYQG